MNVKLSDAIRFAADAVDAETKNRPVLRRVCFHTEGDGVMWVLGTNSYRAHLVETLSTFRGSFSGAVDHVTVLAALDAAQGDDVPILSVVDRALHVGDATFDVIDPELSPAAKAVERVTEQIKATTAEPFNLDAAIVALGKRKAPKGAQVAFHDGATPHQLRGHMVMPLADGPATPVLFNRHVWDPAAKALHAMPGDETTTVRWPVPAWLPAVLSRGPVHAVVMPVRVLG